MTTETSVISLVLSLNKAHILKATHCVLFHCAIVCSNFCYASLGKTSLHVHCAWTAPQTLFTILSANCNGTGELIRQSAKVEFLQVVHATNPTQLSDIDYL